MAKLITINPEVVLDIVLDELDARGVLIDNYEDVFGALSFDEVVEKMVEVSVTRPVEIQ